MDEDVGTHIVGNHLAVRLFVGVRHPLCIADCGRFSSRSEVENGPYGFVRCFQKTKSFLFFCVILSERTNASRRISTAQSKRGRGVYAPNSSANVTLRAWNCNAFT